MLEATSLFYDWTSPLYCLKASRALLISEVEAGYSQQNLCDGF